MKLLITNLVYGERYADLFLDQHLKSFLDERNIPAFRDQVEYLIFTDQETLPKITKHANFFRLQSLVPTYFSQFDWNDLRVNRYDMRYSLLVYMFKESVRVALQRSCMLSALVADMVVAQEFLEKIFFHMKQGYGALFCLPIRSAAEAMIPELDKVGRALPASELCRLAYTNLHPLWTACHWHSPQFSKLPFSLVWNARSGLLVRSFAVTPIVFLPTPEMAQVEHVIDVVVPMLCKNPYWVHDWTECPVAGVELLHCYYPTFWNEPASVNYVVDWAMGHLHPSQYLHLSKTFYYPNKISFEQKIQNIQSESDTVVFEIMQKIEQNQRACDTNSRQIFLS